jgi:hypothetical protein
MLTRSESEGERVRWIPLGQVGVVLDRFRVCRRPVSLAIANPTHITGERARTDEVQLDLAHFVLLVVVADPRAFFHAVQHRPFALRAGRQNRVFLVRLQVGLVEQDVERLFPLAEQLFALRFVQVIEEALFPVRGRFLGRLGRVDVWIGEGALLERDGKRQLDVVACRRGISYSVADSDGGWRSPYQSGTCPDTPRSTLSLSGGRDRAVSLAMPRRRERFVRPRSLWCS